MEEEGPPRGGPSRVKDCRRGHGVSLLIRVLVLPGNARGFGEFASLDLSAELGLVRARKDAMTGLQRCHSG